MDIDGYRVYRDGAGGISLDYSNHKRDGITDLLSITTTPAEQKKGILAIRLYHHRHQDSDGVQVIRLIGPKLYFQENPIEDWQELPREMWGGNQGELEKVLLALSARFMSPHQANLKRAIAEIVAKSSTF